MMGNVLSLLYIGAFLAAGAGLARRLVPHSDVQERLVFASAFATALLAGLPALAALVFDFTLPAALAALAVAAAVAVWGWLPAGGTAMGKGVEKGFWLCVLPAAALTLFARVGEGFRTLPTEDLAGTRRRLQRLADEVELFGWRDYADPAVGR